MKNVFFAILLIAAGLASCSGSVERSPEDIQLDQLVSQTSIDTTVLYIGINIVSSVPDSLKPEMAKWITATVAAASSNMTGGDYEDPEDVIEQAEETANRLFARSTGKWGLFFREHPSSRIKFLTYEELSPVEKQIFQLLKKKS